MEHCIEVTVGDARKSFHCADTERLLHAALRAGIELPYGCATGTCGSCRTTLSAGTVQSMWADAPGKRACKATTDILSCQSVPTSACSLSVRTLGEPGVRPLMQRFAGVLTKVTMHDDGLAWVEIELDKPMQFLPGQFVLLGIEGIQGYRAYSPATGGQSSQCLRLVVRHAAQGAMSPRLCSTNALGLQVDVLGPLGAAHVRAGQDKDMAIVVGGSGCAVALSVIDWAEQSGHLKSHQMDVVVGLRSSTNTSVLTRLSAAALRWPGTLGITLAVSEDERDICPAWPGIRLETGMAPDVAMRCNDIPGWKPRAVFVAGPEVMVQATLRMLMKTGKISPAAVRFDSFS